jgi:tetratricopeptide (TPR) repeat protein
VKFQRTFDLVILIGGFFIFQTGMARMGDSLLKNAMNPKMSDSVRFNAFTKYYIQFHRRYPDSTLIYSQYHLQLATKTNNKNEQLKAHLELGNVLRLRKKYEEALYQYKQAEIIANQSNNILSKADVLHNIGTVWVYKKDYVKAMNYYYQALDLYENTNDKGSIKTTLTSMANVFLLIRNFDMAISQYTYLLKLQKKENLENLTTGIVLSNLGWAYYNTAQFQNAKIQYLKALPIYYKQSDMFLVLSAYLDLSRIYMAMNQPDTAMIYAQKSQQLSLDLHVEESLHESILVKGKILFQKDPKQALAEILPLENKIVRLGNLNLIADLYELFYQCYKILGNTKQALYMHEQYQLYNDSIQNQYFQFEILQEAIKRAHQKQLDAAKLANQRKLDALTIQQLKVNFSIIGGSILILGGLIWLLYRNRNLHHKKRNDLLLQIEELKRWKTTEFMVTPGTFELNRTAIEAQINRKLNETDWKVLNILLEDASISNRNIAEKAFLSTEGIGSSLRRMYDYFDIKDSKYKKINLITQAIKISKEQ